MLHESRPSGSWLIFDVSQETSPMDVTLELATEARIDGLLPHFRAYQAGYRQFSDAGEAQTREFLLALIRDAKSGFVLLARTGPQIIGFATGFVTISGLLATRMIHLGDLYVDPAHRGLSVGARLIEGVRSEAACRGIPIVRWLSVASNAKLNLWYEGLGARSFDFKLFMTDAKKG
jgi:GNAT superfamily N-acetyltransferase